MNGPSLYTVLRRLVALLFGILQGLLVLRLILLLLGANQDNAVVAFVLTVTTPFVAPFRDMFALATVENASGSVLDVAAVIALVAWTLVELVALAIVDLARRDRAAVE
jgi:hypothetical protein